MIIQSINGKTLLETNFRTMRAALEYAVQNEISMAAADLRGANLSRASLEGLHAPGACFWGAKLNGADLGLVNLRGCDFRRADFTDTCLAESDLHGADASGAYFSRTIFNGALLSSVRISCPSIWECDLAAAKTIHEMTYSHCGEIDIRLYAPPLIVRGLQQRMVLMRGMYLWGNEIYGASDIPPELVRAIAHIEGELRDAKCMHNANGPIPKIVARPSTI